MRSPQVGAVGRHGPHGDDSPRSSGLIANSEARSDSARGPETKVAASGSCPCPMRARALPKSLPNWVPTKEMSETAPGESKCQAKNRRLQRGDSECLAVRARRSEPS